MQGGQTKSPNSLKIFDRRQGTKGSESAKKRPREGEGQRKRELRKKEGTLETKVTDESFNPSKAKKNEPNSTRVRLINELMFPSMLKEAADNDRSNKDIEEA